MEQFVAKEEGSQRKETKTSSVASPSLPARRRNEKKLKREILPAYSENLYLSQRKETKTSCRRSS